MAMGELTGYVVARVLVDLCRWKMIELADGKLTFTRKDGRTFSHHGKKIAKLCQKVNVLLTIEEFHPREDGTTGGLSNTKNIRMKIETKEGDDSSAILDRGRKMNV